MSEENSPLGAVGLAATTLYVADLDRAVAWYSEMLGLEPMALGVDGDRYASFLLGGSIVVLEPITAALEAKNPGSESTTINVLVERDADQVREELVARGVRCGGVVASPNFRSFLMRDLDGNRYYIARAVTAEANDAARAAASASRPDGG